MKQGTGFFARVLATAAVLALTSCGGGSSDVASTPTFGSGSGAATPAPGTGAAAALATLQLSATPTTVPTDNSSTTTVTVSALSASNAAISGVDINLGTNTGVLGSATVTTGANGTATFTFGAGTLSKANRTATVTASSTTGAVTTQLPIQIVGSTVTASTNNSSVVDSGASPATLTITVKDSGGNPIASTPVTLAAAGTGGVTIPATATTSATGTVAVSVAGNLAGTSTVTVTAAGATASQAYTITPSTSTFAIDQTTNSTSGAVTASPSLVAMNIGDSLIVEANAPAPATTVTFATTLGSLNGGGTSVTVATGAGCVPAVAAKACATLTTAVAGLATVQAFDPANVTSSATISVAMTAKVASKITLQASPSVVAKSIGSTTGVSTLVATVTDATGLPVGGAPVAFSIINPTGGGESISPVVAFSASTPSSTLALGQASGTFTSGSLSSPASGVEVRASVLGTAVATETIGIDVTASGPDAAIVVGGTAGSIAFGQATSLSEANNATNYALAMSVLVADVNGSPAPAGTVVNLSAWPIAFSTGSSCLVDADSAVLKTGTFKNEDVNENLVLDAGEDGTRTFYSGGATVAGGTTDNALTPPNSAGGIVPSQVTTDANGVATFSLTYGKSNALWIVTRIRAKTIVQGTATSSEVQFRLPALQGDTSPCHLPNSTYTF